MNKRMKILDKGDDDNNNNIEHIYSKSTATLTHTRLTEPGEDSRYVLSMLGVAQLSVVNVDHGVSQTVEEDKETVSLDQSYSSPSPPSSSFSCFSILLLFLSHRPPPSSNYYSSSFLLLQIL